jgi:hypothetical protein
MRQEFDAQNYIRLPNLIEPQLMQILQREIDRAVFPAKEFEFGGGELSMEHNLVSGTLNFLASDPKLTNVVRKITGCSSIGSFGGRVYRVMPASGQNLDWHDDVMNERLVAMSLNLSPQLYEGGTLEFRESKSQQPLGAVLNDGYGNAILFRVASHLQHRTTELFGTVPKTAFAGWFVSEPDFSSHMRSFSKERRALQAYPSTESTLSDRATARDLGIRVALAEEAAYRRLNEQTIVVHLGTGVAVSLDGVSSRIWELLSDGKNLRAICAIVTNEYEVSREEFERDLLEIIRKLEAGGLVVVI